MKKIALTLVLVAVLLGSGVLYVRAYASEDLREFVALLIVKGVIAPSQADRAYSFVDIIAGASKETDEEEGVLNADKVSIAASQLIQFGNREYAQGEDIRGMVLNVTNTTDEVISLEGRRRCILSYKIYKGDEMLFDSAQHEPCTGTERVTYQMEGKQTRILEMIHKADALALDAGSYKVVLEYPGYGVGEREFTVK